MTPNYIAKKSILPAFTFLRVLFFWLIIPTIIIIADIIKRKHYSIEFYNDYVMVKKGVFQKDELKSIFPRIISVSTRISIWGYGDVIIDTVGKNDLDLTQMANPKELRAYLQSNMVSGDVVSQVSNNPFATVIN